jgi:hypothetical protein
MGAHVGLADAADGDGRPAMDEQMMKFFLLNAGPSTTSSYRLIEVQVYFSVFGNHNVLNTVCAFFILS